MLVPCGEYEGRGRRHGATQARDEVLVAARDDVLLGEALLAGMLGRAPFRLIGIGISDLHETDATAAPPPDLFESDQTALRRAEAATDEIRARFGKNAIIRGRALR